MPRGGRRRRAENWIFLIIDKLRNWPANASYRSVSLWPRIVESTLLRSTMRKWALESWPFLQRTPHCQLLDRGVTLVRSPARVDYTLFTITQYLGIVEWLIRAHNVKLVILGEHPTSGNVNDLHGNWQRVVALSTSEGDRWICHWWVVREIGAKLKFEKIEFLQDTNTWRLKKNEQEKREFCRDVFRMRSFWQWLECRTRAYPCQTVRIEHFQTSLLLVHWWRVNC